MTKKHVKLPSRQRVNKLTLCIPETPKQVILQTVKTQMLHFIWVHTVCKGKKISSDKKIQIF